VHALDERTVCAPISGAGGFELPLTITDRQDLQDLMTRYAYAVDGEGTEAVFVQILTEDVILDGPWGRRVGIDAIKDFARRVAERKGVQLRHHITNILADGDGGRATLKAYFVEFQTPPSPDVSGKGRSSEILNVGTYDCVAIKIAGQWRLQRRTVTLDNT
jgi:hypothetical protein